MSSWRATDRWRPVAICLSRLHKADPCSALNNMTEEVMIFIV